MYGESFSQNSLRHFSDYYSKDEVESVIIENKIAFLESIVKLAATLTETAHALIESGKTRAECTTSNDSEVPLTWLEATDRDRK